MIEIPGSPIVGAAFFGQSPMVVVLTLHRAKFSISDALRSSMLAAFSKMQGTCQLSLLLRQLRMMYFPTK